MFTYKDNNNFKKRRLINIFLFIFFFSILMAKHKFKKNNFKAI